MKTVRAVRTAYASDPGLERGVNEDRVLVDEERGIYLVVDGLGGHAAGEMAAETAVRVIGEQLAHLEESADLERAIARAIAEANNQIFELAQGNENWQGMACVLTLALVRDEFAVVGHVGDTRLYLVWNGTLRKLTSDHSPVGEKEDQGLLTEEAAMRHPRRNEVYRDVGSQPRNAEDPNFVQLKRFPFRADAALLLCSDGLSDVLSSSEISHILDRYDGNPEPVAQKLIAAANQAGGRDNVSVVFIAGPEFLGGRSDTLDEVRSRHAATRPRSRILSRGLWIHALTLLAGILLGMLFWALIVNLVPGPAAKTSLTPVPKHLTVNAIDPLGILKAVHAANSGDTIEVPAGNYLGPVELKDGISLLATAPRQVFLRDEVSNVPDTGIGIVARGVNHVRVSGLDIVGDATHPLRLGALLANSSVELDDTNISGASEAGLRISGSSSGVLLGNYFHDNLGPGMVILDTSSPRIVGNKISNNGKSADNPAPGLTIDASAHPTLENNIITQNGLATLGSLPPPVENLIRSQNLVDAVIAAPAHPKAVSSNAKP